MNAVPAHKLHLMTVAEFLEWPGDGTDTRYDLVGGEPVAQARPSVPHATIMANIAIVAGAALRDRPPCRVMVEVGIFKSFSHITARGADAAITCEPVGRGRGISPAVVFEVLSPSNRADSFAKVLFYATIDSIEEIVLVESERIGAIVYRRAGGDGWADKPAEVLAGLEAVLFLPSVGIEMPLLEIYRNVAV